MHGRCVRLENEIPAVQKLLEELDVAGLARAKIHRRCWQEGPELGAFSSGIRLGSDYPPRRQHWRGVNGAFSAEILERCDSCGRIN